MLRHVTSRARLGPGVAACAWQGLPKTEISRTLECARCSSLSSSQGNGGSQRSSAPTDSGLDLMAKALGAQQEQRLIQRLSGLWGLPSELLSSQMATLQILLEPANLDTPAHALWMLVRCPNALRHASEQELRAGVRELNALVNNELSRPQIKTAIYRHPWMLDATSHQSGWKREAAALVLEMHKQAAAAGRAAPPSTTLPLLAVRAYVAAAEAARVVRAPAAALGRLFGWPKDAGAGASAAGTPSAIKQPHAAPRQASGHRPSSPPARVGRTTSGGSSSSSGGGGSSAGRAAQQSQHSFSTLQHGDAACLQQLALLVAASPTLGSLPPELLLSRWQSLLHVLGGAVDPALALAAGNPHLLCSCAEIHL